MNDDLFRKISGVTSAYDKIKDIAGIGNSSLAALSGVNGILNSSMYNAIHKNPTLSAMSGVDMLLKNIYVEPVIYNPLMAVFGNVTQMMKHYEDNVVNNSSKNILASLSSLTASNIIANLPTNNSVKFLSSFSDLAENYKWRETYPTAFLNDSLVKQYSKGFDKFNSNIEKLIDLKFIDENSTLVDGLAVSLNLDYENTEINESELIEIFNIINQAFEILIEHKNESFNKLNSILKGLSKFINHQYTYGLAMILVGIFLTKHFESTTSNISEEIIIKKEIGVKHKAINNYKDFVRIPIGSEIEIIKKYKIWAKISFINGNGIPQIGYCRIKDL